MIECLVCEKMIHPIQDMGVHGKMIDKCPTPDCGAVLGKGNQAVKPIEVMDGMATLETQRVDFDPLETTLDSVGAKVALGFAAVAFPKKTLDAEEASSLPPPPGSPPASTFSVLGMGPTVTRQHEEPITARARARLQKIQEQQQVLALEERMLRSILGEDPH